MNWYEHLHTVTEINSGRSRPWREGCLIIFLYLQHVALLKLTCYYDQLNKLEKRKCHINHHNYKQHFIKKSNFIILSIKPLKLLHQKRNTLNKVKIPQFGVACCVGLGKEPLKRRPHGSPCYANQILISSHARWVWFEKLQAKAVNLSWSHMIFTSFYRVQRENRSLYWLLNQWIQSKSIRKLWIRDLSTFFHKNILLAHYFLI